MARRKATTRSKTPKLKGSVAESTTADDTGPEVIPPAKVASDTEKREAMQRLMDADKEAKEANKKKNSKSSKYRALFKEAMKMTGFSEDQLSWYMQNRERDAEEIDAETRGRNAIAKFMQMAIGGQLGLDVDGQSVASKGETATSDRLDNDPRVLKATRAQGEQAGIDAAERKSGFPEGSKRDVQWLEGYDSEQRKRAEGIKSTKPMARTSIANEPATAH